MLGSKLHYPQIQVELLGGFNSGSGGSSVAAVKFMQTVFPETYANFYYLIGGGLVSTLNRKGTEWLGGVGVQFFIPGIDSIGWSFETGMSLENVTTASYVLKTFGFSFIQAGMHFYF